MCGFFRSRVGGCLNFFLECISAVFPTEFDSQLHNEAEDWFFRLTSHMSAWGDVHRVFPVGNLTPLLRWGLVHILIVGGIPEIFAVGGLGWVLPPRI